MIKELTVEETLEEIADIVKNINNGNYHLTGFWESKRKSDNVFFNEDSNPVISYKFPKTPFVYNSLAKLWPARTTA